MHWSKILGFGIIFSVAAIQAETKKWEPTDESLSKHTAPEWLKDLKLGVQYVGSQRDLNDVDWYHWSRAVQRARQRGFDESDEHSRKHLKDFEVVGGFPFAWDVEKEKDLEATMKQYERIGAKFLVSMLHGAYPGTEGFLMTQEEAEAAKKAGLKVGLHYNLLRRGRVPAAGDPGYVEWWHKRVQDEVNKIGSEFVFFDGGLSSSAYFKTKEFVAWYYNWADANGKEVWVNDDWGRDCEERIEYGDVFEGEGYTFSGVMPKTFVNWDILRNGWNCWVNEFGLHKRVPMEEKWNWEYRTPDEMLQLFAYNVSIGGVWVVQMINTKQAWEQMMEVGDWLKVNGEAIYYTRPVGEPDKDYFRIPIGRKNPLPGTPKHPNINSVDWQWRFYQSLFMARQNGPIYLTQKEDTLYAIHWGLPSGEITLPDITAKPGSELRMLGVDKPLNWKQEGKDIKVQVPAELPCKYGVSFAIKKP